MTKLKRFEEVFPADYRGLRLMDADRMAEWMGSVVTALEELQEKFERVEKWIDFWETVDTGWKPPTNP